MTNSGNNQEVAALFYRLCGLSDESNSESSKREDLAVQIVILMKAAFKSQLKQEQVGKPYSMPYKDLTDLVFAYSDNFAQSETLINIRGVIEKAVLEDEYCTLELTEERKQEKKNHFMSCYDKMINHIQLAQTQRDFINRIIEDAMDLAKSTNELANSTNKIIDETKRIANEAEQNAEQANKIAAEAEKTYNTMFANYVTILGIFTAIIVTIFGGLNVVDAVIGYGDTHFSTIIFLAALVLMCVICLLYFLAKIILKLNGKDESNQKFTLEYLFGVIFIVCIGLIVFAWCVSPTKITPDHPTKIEQKAD